MFRILEIPRRYSCLSWTDKGKEAADKGKKPVTEEGPRTYELDLSHFEVVFDCSENLLRSRRHARPDFDCVEKDRKVFEMFPKDWVYVRTYKHRYDLLRVMIVGPEGTPYHDGLFVYDFQLPRDFPRVPPLVLDVNSRSYEAAGLDWEEIMRRNGYPRNAGGEITYSEDQSTIVMFDYLHDQVLKGRTGPVARMYNMKEFFRTWCQMEIYLKKPPQHFEDIVYNHFCERGRFILNAFTAYATGLVEVGKYKDPFGAQDGLKSAPPAILKGSTSRRPPILESWTHMLECSTSEQPGIPPATAILEGSTSQPPEMLGASGAVEGLTSGPPEIPGDPDASGAGEGPTSRPPAIPESPNDPEGESSFYRSRMLKLLRDLAVAIENNKKEGPKRSKPPESQLDLSWLINTIAAVERLDLGALLLPRPRGTCLKHIVHLRCILSALFLIHMMFYAARGAGPSRAAVPGGAAAPAAEVAEPAGHAGPSGEAVPSAGPVPSGGVGPMRAQEKRHSSRGKAAMKFVKRMTRILKCASTEVEQGSGSSDTQETVMGGGGARPSTETRLSTETRPSGAAAPAAEEPRSRSSHAEGAGPSTETGPSAGAAPAGGAGPAARAGPASGAEPSAGLGSTGAAVRRRKAPTELAKWMTRTFKCADTDVKQGSGSSDTQETGMGAKEAGPSTEAGPNAGAAPADGAGLAEQAGHTGGAEPSAGVGPSGAQEKRRSSHKKAARELVKWTTRILRCATTDVDQGSGSSDTQETVLGDKGKEAADKANELDELDLSQFKIVPGYGYREHLMRRREDTKPELDYVQKDWNVFKMFLQEEVYVRTYEERYDLLRVMIVGPQGTPYHDGLFFYDLQLPKDFPKVPPFVLDISSLKYPAAGLDWEEIMYRNGCPPNTGGEITYSEEQSMTVMFEYLYKQVLKGRTGPGSRMYNTKEFFRTWFQTEIYIRKPPRQFEDIVYNHFRERGRFILNAFMAYATGVVEVGKYKEPLDGSRSAPPAFLEGVMPGALGAPPILELWTHVLEGPTSELPDIPPESLECSTSQPPAIQVGSTLAGGGPTSKLPAIPQDPNEPDDPGAGEGLTSRLPEIPENPNDPNDSGAGEGSTSRLPEIPENPNDPDDPSAGEGSTSRLPVNLENIHDPEAESLFDKPRIRKLLDDLTEAIENNEKEGPKRYKPPEDIPPDQSWYMRAIEAAEGVLKEDIKAVGLLGTPDEAEPSGGAVPAEGAVPGVGSSEAQERRRTGHKKSAREFVKWMTRILGCASTDVEQASGSSDTQETVWHWRGGGARPSTDTIISTETILSGAAAPAEGADPAGHAEPSREATPSAGPVPIDGVGSSGTEQRRCSSHKKAATEFAKRMNRTFKGENTNVKQGSGSSDTQETSKGVYTYRILLLFLVTNWIVVQAQAYK
ncbi:hypothetical protein Cgig2_029121 [Carnegiea gigantea]|uniref:UBC core domain-containing protein n=1 Tax=Carnegiea gigantea TaxID=171969 RepID=A0A9Q1QJV8_9CARY|nr:hypothetical protein Cgig2_029121 [Carnegiea gigantea]